MDFTAMTIQQLEERKAAIAEELDAEGAEMSSDRGILLGIILNFCHFLSDLKGLTL